MPPKDKLRALCKECYAALNWLVTACDGMETIYTKSTIRQDFFDTSLSGGRELVNRIKLNGGIDDTIKQNNGSNRTDS